MASCDSGFGSGGDTPNTPSVPGNIAVTSVSIKASTNLVIGGTETLTAVITPSNASNQNVTWSSSNSGVATIANGLVTAKAAGSAIIIVTTVDGGKTAFCTVTVSATAVAVIGVSLNKTSTALAVNSTETLTPTILPSNATNRNVTWSSSNSSVATVVNGMVIAKTAGTATITVTTADGGKTATCSVTVSLTGSTPPVGGGDQPFTSWEALTAWLFAQPNNTKINPYLVKVNVSNANGFYYFGNEKYINLDLSGSTFTSIGESAFQYRVCLASVTIPNNVTSIQESAFVGCVSLTSVTFQGTMGLNGLHYYAFNGDLYDKFYATSEYNGTPGRYTTTAPVGRDSVWTKQ